jgi:hypothetical protein
MKIDGFFQKRLFSVLACLAISIFLSSCVSEGQRMINEGASPAYGQGYDDGCNSGKKAAGDMFSQFHKNVRQYQHSQDYRQGWDDGHNECKSEWISMNRQQGLAIEQQRAADEHSLIENMKQDNAQQYVPKLNAREVQELNKLGH